MEPLTLHWDAHVRLEVRWQHHLQRVAVVDDGRVGDLAVAEGGLGGRGLQLTRCTGSSKQRRMKA